MAVENDHELLLEDVNDDEDVSLSNLRLSDPVWRALAQKELGESDEAIRNGILQLRKMIKEDTRMKCCLDEEVLLLFLRSKKFDVEGTFEKIKNCCHVMAALRHLRDKMRMSHLGYVYRLPFLCQGQDLDCRGRKVVTCLLGRWNPATSPFDDVILAVLLCLQGIIASDARTQVGGFVFVIDMSGFGFRHLSHVSPSFLKLLPFMLKDCNPMRLKQINVVNESRVFDFLHSIVRPFLGNKMKNRIVFHGSNYQASLHEQVSPALLPAALGGTCPTFEESPFTEAAEALEKNGFLRGIVDLDYDAGKEASS